MPESTSVVAAVGSASGVGVASAIAKITVHNPLPHDHPFYSVIGRVAAEWARLEHLLDITIWELSGMESRMGSCITGQMVGHYPRFGAIEALAAAKGFGGPMLGRIIELGNRTGQVAKSRNRFVHDAWYIESESGDVAQFKSFSGRDQSFGHTPITDDYAAKTLSHIREKVDEIERLRSDLARGPAAK